MSNFNWDDYEEVTPEEVEQPQQAELQASQEAPEETKKPASEAKAFSWDDFEEASPEEIGNPVLDKVEADQAQERFDRPEVGRGDAALRGAEQGLLWGASDELASVAETVGQTFGVKGLGANTFDELGTTTPYWLDDKKELYDVFKERLAAQRAEQKAAEEQHPLEYTGGLVVGSVASPGLGALKATKALTSGAGKLATKAGGITDKVVNSGIGQVATKAATGGAVGYGTGMVAGLGEAEGNLLERLPQAQETAEMGGVIGATIPALGGVARGGGKALEMIGEIPLIRDVVRGAKHGLQGTNVFTRSARKNAAADLRETGGNFFDEMKKLQHEIGEGVEQEAIKAAKAGRKTDLNKEVHDGLARLRHLKETGGPSVAEYAAEVERKIMDSLDIKAPSNSYLGVSKADLPEGINVPKPDAPDFNLDPLKARELKKELQRLSPKFGGDDLVYDAAVEAKKIAKASGEKLNQLSEDLAEEGSTTLKTLNNQYGEVKKAFKRLLLEDTGDMLPSQIKEKINNILYKITDDTHTGDNAEVLIKDVLEHIKKVDPELSAKYGPELTHLADKLKAITDFQTGFGGIAGGTPKSLAMGTGNLAGMGARYSGAALATKGVKAVAKNPLTHKALTRAGIQGPISGELGPIEYGKDKIEEKLEPHMIRKRVAETAEKADPELLKNQAAAIRTQFGDQGEKLATILDRMADQGKDARRALMFTVLQNQAYRKMLGLRDDENTR